VKKLGIFYFIIVVLLSIMPCGDALETGFDVVNTIQVSSHNKQNNTSENCTSICLCACCGQSIVSPSQLIFECRIAFSNIQHQVLDADFKLYNRSNAIWQPPRIDAEY
jgi:hypothetical protein